MTMTQEPKRPEWTFDEGPRVTTSTVSIDGATVTIACDHHKGLSFDAVYNLLRGAALGIGFTPYTVNDYLPYRD